MGGPPGAAARHHARPAGDSGRRHDLDHLGYEDGEKSIADTGWWEEEGRTGRRLLFTLHGRDGSVSYALIHTGRDWLLHRTKDQPG